MNWAAGGLPDFGGGLAEADDRVAEIAVSKVRLYAGLSVRDDCCHIGLTGSGTSFDVRWRDVCIRTIVH